MNTQLIINLLQIITYHTKRNITTTRL